MEQVLPNSRAIIIMFVCMPVMCIFNNYNFHIRNVRCIELFPAVSVAGFSSEYPNEIIQLSLPEKLLPPDKQVGRFNSS